MTDTRRWNKRRRRYRKAERLALLSTLLQQNRPTAEVRRFTTSSARARSDGGTLRPSRFGRPMHSCVVNSRTRSTLALFEHFQRPVGVHGHYQLAADHLEHGQVGIDHERYAPQRHHRNPPPDPELACDHLIAVR